ncbi:MAG TPA: uracil-DNA glycosylase [Armatimonadota bacterium]|nr:uracil-DNA glycosylase [Armatimonadota bacterium]
MKQTTGESAKHAAMEELKTRSMGKVPNLCAPGHPLVWGEGSLAAKVAIVGEAPGDEEEQLGRPFVGPAGALLDRELKQAGLDRKDIWITNAVKCRPVKEISKQIVNRSPTVREIRGWSETLMEELEIIAPQIILCAGAVAARAIIRKDFALTKERGRWFNGPLGTMVIATFHPAYILRQTGEDWDRTIKLFKSDIRKVAEAIESGEKEPEAHI